MQSAQGFYGDSLGRLKGQLQSDRAQLEELMEQFPPQAQAQLQEMIDSYTEVEGTLDQAASDQGLDDEVNEAAQQAEDAAGGAAQQAQDTAGQVAGQAQDAWARSPTRPVRRRGKPRIPPVRRSDRLPRLPARPRKASRTPPGGPLVRLKTPRGR